MAINKSLLRKVRNHILEDERRFDMMRFVERRRGSEAPPCGTVGCIAGWAVMLADGIPKRITVTYYEGVGKRAAELLGLSEDESSSLFYDPCWPEPFHARYLKEKSKARVAA